MSAPTAERVREAVARCIVERFEGVMASRYKPNVDDFKEATLILAAIVRETGISWEMVREAREYADLGDRPMDDVAIAFSAILLAAGVERSEHGD